MSTRNNLGYSGFVNTDDNALARAQDFANIQSSRVSNQIPIKNAVIVDATVLTTDTAVNHGLGRIPVGYLIIDRDAGETVFTSPSANPSPESQLILRATGSVTVKVMVF